MSDLNLDGQELLLGSSLPVCVIDQQGVIHLANAGFCRMAGISNAETRADPGHLGKYIHIEMNTLWQKLDFSFCGHSCTVYSTGSVVQMSGYRIEDDRLLVLMFCNMQSVNLRQQKRIEIEREFYNALWSSALPIMIYNTEQIFYLNEAAEKLLGYPAVFEATSIPEDFFRHKTHKKLVQNAQKRLSGEKVAPTYESEIITREGEKRYIKISVQVTTYRGIKALLATFADLTKNHHFEQELQKAQQELESKIEQRTRQLQIWNENLQTEIQKRRRSDQALRESEEKYRKLVEMANEVITIINKEGVITFINRYGAERLGFEVNEVIGKSLYDIFSPYYAEKHLDAIKRVIESHRLEQYENVSELKGEKYWFNTTLQPIERRGCIEALLIIYDITELKRQQEELTTYRQHLEELVKARTEALSNINAKLQNEILEKERIQTELTDSKEQYRLLVEHQLEIIVQVDSAGRFCYVSPSCCRLLGKEEDALLGSEFRNYIYEGDVEKAMQIWSALQHPPFECYLEQRIKTTKGLRWFAWSIKALLDNRNALSSVMAVGRDITEKKEAERDLEQSEKRFRDVIDRSIDGYLFLDKNGRVQYQNRALQEIFGYSLEEIKERVFRDFIWPDALEHADKLFSTIMGGKPLYWHELRVKHKNGSMRWAGFNMRRVILNGIVVGVEGFIKDITEAVNTRKRLKKLSARLVDIQEEERARISREIHDSLGQSLTALQFEITATKAALNNDAERARNMLDRACNMVKESIGIAQNLCYTLRPPLLDDFGLISALNDYIEEFQTRWQVPVRFKYNRLNGELDNAAEIALFRVTQEALNNVLKYASAEKIYIKLWKQKRFVCYLIRDYGNGFDTTMLYSAKNEKFGVLGMKERIELQGGEFAITSRPGLGTRVFIKIPFKCYDLQNLDKPTSA